MLVDYAVIIFGVAYRILTNARHLASLRVLIILIMVPRKAYRIFTNVEHVAPGRMPLFEIFGLDYSVHL